MTRESHGSFLTHNDLLLQVKLPLDLLKTLIRINDKNRSRWGAWLTVEQPAVVVLMDLRMREMDQRIRVTGEMIIVINRLCIF